MATTIILTRPRPRPNGHETEEIEITLQDFPDDTPASILRRAADQLDAGPTLPPVA